MKVKPTNTQRCIRSSPPRPGRTGTAEPQRNSPEQSSESKEHAGLFRTAAKNFGLLTPIEQHHAETYGVALEALRGKGTAGQADQPIPGKWICKVCSMIYDHAEGDPDSGIAAGTPFEAIPNDWHCPICGVHKASFVPYREAELKAA